MNHSNFHRVAAMNEAFGNPKGDPIAINTDKVRSQTRNILDEFCEVQLALGATPASVQSLLDAAKNLQYSGEVALDDVRDGLCDIHVFAYGAHHLMGIDADRDMNSVVDGVMTRFIKDASDKQATISKHAAKGVTQVYFEGEFPVMVMKSAVDQPDAPKGKFLKSASYREPTFYKAAEGCGAIPDGRRTVPRLPSPIQLRAALKFCPDPELAKSIYMSMVDAATLT